MTHWTLGRVVLRSRMIVGMDTLSTELSSTTMKAVVMAMTIEEVVQVWVVVEVTTDVEQVW